MVIKPSNVEIVLKCVLEYLRIYRSDRAKEDAIL